MSFDELYFRGHEPRRCGEHVTVGTHRAWCVDDGEWCYPSSSCAGCGPTREDLEAQIERYRLAWISARRRADHGRQFLLNHPWPEGTAILDEFDDERRLNRDNTQTRLDS